MGVEDSRTLVTPVPGQALVVGLGVDSTPRFLNCGFDLTVLSSVRVS